MVKKGDWCVINKCLRHGPSCYAAQREAGAELEKLITDDKCHGQAPRDGFTAAYSASIYAS